MSHVNLRPTSASHHAQWFQIIFSAVGLGGQAKYANVLDYSFGTFQCQTEIMIYEMMWTYGFTVEAFTCI